MTTARVLFVCLTLLYTATASSHDRPEFSCTNYEMSSQDISPSVETCQRPPRVSEDHQEVLPGLLTPRSYFPGKEESLCFTVWQEELSGAVTVIRQGCFSSVPSLKRTPTCSSTCLDNITTIEDVREDSQLLFCCCNTKNCNQQFEWKRRASSKGRLSIIIDCQTSNLYRD